MSTCQQVQKLKKTNVSSILIDLRRSGYPNRVLDLFHRDYRDGRLDLWMDKENESNHSESDEYYTEN